MPSAKAARVLPGRGQANDLTAPVAGMRTAFHEAEVLQLVHDDRGVGAIDAVRLGELGEGHRMLAEQEQDADPPAARAQAEPLLEHAAVAVGVDELPHQLPGGGRKVGGVGPGWPVN
jgi:hypothetical protein